jgi:hypothetical protein
MRLKHKAEQWNADPQLGAILKELSGDGSAGTTVDSFSKKHSATLLAHAFDKDAMTKRRFPLKSSIS